MLIEPGTHVKMSSYVASLHESFAIDGVYNDINNFAATKHEFSPWIQINLVKYESIIGVKIWNSCLPQGEKYNFVSAQDRRTNILIHTKFW